ncbi:recombinase family protein [Novosphingobium sp. KA1]|uniref:recombinase family protein n=1 Tax=Novosphingobium sp. (strain KA1) TaxID=164608 RepID=UPI001A8E2527|nr:recombinase family protein [Novosphingobium sp. KA1]QSR15758.1 hypothetical protein CA833_00830 [Novosphingobium sp. KA1]
MEAIVYIRWSTLNQEDGNSLERQKALAEAVAKTHGWTINPDEIHIESGKSAYHGRNRAQNGKLRQIEDRAARGELAGKVLIVEAMDRLSRQEPLESLNLLVGLCKQGLTICEAGTGIIYDTAKINDNWANLIVALAKAGEAHDSSKLKARRITSTWRKTQEEGKTKTGTADPRLCPAWMEVIDGEFTVIEERADIIREMFRLSLQGYGLRHISDRSNEARETLGWPKAAWTIRTVSNMLHSRRVLGEYQPQRRTDSYGREDVAPARKIYPEIVTPEQWHQVQASIASRKGTGGPRTKNVNVLSHVCRCTHRQVTIDEDGQERVSAVPCGSRMSIRTHKRQRWQLVCADFARAGSCKGNATFIYEHLLKGLLDNISHFVRAAPALPQDDTLARIALKRSEVQTMQKRLEKLADDVMLSDDQTLRAAYERFKERVKAAETELRALEGQRESKEAAIPSSEAINELEKLRANMEDVEVRQRMQVLIDGLVDAIFLHEEDRSATVVLMGGLVAFKLDKKGKLIGQPVDALDMLDVPSDDHDLALIAAGGDPLRSAAIKRADQIIRPKD